MTENDEKAAVMVLGALILFAASVVVLGAALVVRLA